MTPSKAAILCLLFSLGECSSFMYDNVFVLNLNSVTPGTGIKAEGGFKEKFPFLATFLAGLQLVVFLLLVFVLLLVSHDAAGSKVNTHNSAFSQTALRFTLLWTNCLFQESQTVRLCPQS